MKTFIVKLFNGSNEFTNVEVEAEDFGDAWTKAAAMVDDEGLIWTADVITDAPAATDSSTL